MIVRYGSFSLQQEDNVTTLKLSRIVGDSLVAEELIHQLAAYIDDIEPHNLVIDFVDVDGCPSAVIAALVAAQRRLEAFGGRMKLAIPSSRIRDVFKRLNLNLLFDIYDNLDDAIRVCREAASSN